MTITARWSGGKRRERGEDVAVDGAPVRSDPAATSSSSTLGAMGPRACGVDRAVHDDPVQPRAERPAAVEAVEVAGSRRGTPPGRCPRRARCRGRRGTRRGAPAASGPRTAPRGQRRIRAGRLAPRRARPGLRAPPQDHTTGRPTEVHDRDTARRSREVPGPLAASARTPGMNRRELLAAAAGLPLALALPRPRQPARARRRRRGARDGRPGVARRRGRPRHRARRAAASELRPALAASRAAFVTWAVVAHTATGRLTVLHAPTLRVRGVVDGFGEPRYTAVHPVRYPSGPRADPTSRTPRAARSSPSTSCGEGSCGGPRCPGLRGTSRPAPAAGCCGPRSGRRPTRVAVLDLARPAPAAPHADVLATVPRPRRRLSRRTARHVWVTSGDARRIAVYERDGGSLPRSSPAMLRRSTLPSRGGGCSSRAATTARCASIGGDGSVVGTKRVPAGSYNVTSHAADSAGWPRVTPSLGLGTLALLDERGPSAASAASPARPTTPASS